MTAREIAAFGLRAAALVFKVVGVLWGCAFVLTLGLSAFELFDDDFRRSLTLNLATGIPTAANLFFARHFRRRAEAIVRLPPTGEHEPADRCTAEMLVAVIVVYGAFTVIEPLRTIVVDWRNAPEFVGFPDFGDDFEPAESVAWSPWLDYRMQQQFIRCGTALVCLFGAKYLVRGMLWLKRRRTPSYPSAVHASK